MNKVESFPGDPAILEVHTPNDGAKTALADSRHVERQAKMLERQPLSLGNSDRKAEMQYKIQQAQEAQALEESIVKPQTRSIGRPRSAA